MNTDRGEMDSESTERSSAPETDASLRAAAAPGAGSSSGAAAPAIAPLEEGEIRARLRRWILERAKAIAGVELTDQTPILESGLLSSLDVVELVLFIEELRGEEIETDALEPEVFTSVDTLWRAFFAGRAGARP